MAIPPKPPTETDAVSTQYQGRQAKRANSRQRQRDILEATLRLIATDGIRAVRHRAIAKEANVPLAATTYYFKDINDLISDAFQLFSEKNSSRNNWLKEQAALLLQEKSAEFPDQIALLRRTLIEPLLELLLSHIKIQVDDTQARRIEHAFINESLRNHVIGESYKRPRGEIIGAITQFLELLGIDEAEADSHSMHALIQWLEYLLVVENTDENWQKARTILSRQLGRILD